MTNTKEVFTLETMNKFITMINQAQTLEEIFKVGAELTKYEMDNYGYKAAVSKIYSARKRELIDQRLEDKDSPFTLLFFGFTECSKARKSNKQLHWDTAAKRYARLAYYLKENKVISDREYSILMGKYEEATGRPVGNGNGIRNGKDDTEEVPF